MYRLAVLNLCTVVPEAALSAAVDGLKAQVQRDLSPPPPIGWGIAADIVYVPKGQPAPTDRWWLCVVDDVDAAGYLGRHDLTPAGLPMGKVFAKTVLQYGKQVSASISHEGIEMLVDPYLNQYYYAAAQGRLYSKEVSDPLQANAWGYQINGCPLLCDFVLPPFYAPAPTAGAKYSITGKITAPMTVAPGGYLPYYDLKTHTWSSVMGETIVKGKGAKREQFQAREYNGSRREKRQILMRGESLIESED